MTTMTQQEASAKISSLIAEATAKINEAETFQKHMELVLVGMDVDMVWVDIINQQKKKILMENGKNHRLNQDGKHLAKAVNILFNGELYNEDCENW